MFGSVLACGLAVVYWIGRAGFANPVRPVAVTLGIALFIICMPAVVSSFLRRTHEHTGTWWVGASFLGIVCIAITAAAGFIVYPTPFNLGGPIALAGALAFVAAGAMWAMRSRLVSAILMFVFAALFTAWVGGIAWGTRYKTPLFWEQLSDRGNVHHDPLYYVSMANSMRAYGVPSTGLDGVPYIPYHYGSAWLNSQWADLAGVDVLTFYSLGPTVLVAPVFFAGLLLFAGRVRALWRAKERTNAVNIPMQQDVWTWLVLIGATVGFMPSNALDALGVWNRHLLISESYLTALALFALCAGLAADWWSGRAERQSRADVVFAILLVPALLVCLGFLKLSLMLLCLAVVIWMVVRAGLYKNRLMLAGTLLAVALAVVTFKLVSVPAQNQGLTPFSYMRYQADPRWWPYFLFGHFLWSWVYIAVRVREENLPTLSDLLAALRDRRLLDAEIVAIVAVCGFLPGELITIHGGSAVYFSDVQRWLSAPLLMAIGVRVVPGRKMSLKRGISNARLGAIAAALIAIPVGFTVTFNVARAVREATQMNAALRANFYSYAGVKAQSGWMTEASVLAAGLQKAPDYAMITALRSLDSEPRELKRQTLLFIPQSDSAFWKVFSEPDRCSFASLVGPSTSGLALLDGMPPADCDLTDQYGMAVYTRRTALQTAEDIATATLCRKAGQKGFRRVVVLQDESGGRYTTPVIDCPYQ